MRIVTHWYPNLEPPPSEVTILILPNIVRKLPEDETPPSGAFRCFVCWEVKGRRHFGGRVYGKNICRECYPYVDDWTVSCLIHFDKRRGFDKADPSGKTVKPKWHLPPEIRKAMLKSIELEKAINNRIKAGRGYADG